jgi:hypothetical protein
MCDPSASAPVVAEAALPDGPQFRTARLTLDLGYANAEAAAVARDLATGVLTQLEALLADPATDLPAYLRGVLAALADALSEQTGGEATVTALNTPLAHLARPSGRTGPRRSSRSRPSGRPWPAER